MDSWPLPEGQDALHSLLSCAGLPTGWQPQQVSSSISFPRTQVSRFTATPEGLSACRHQTFNSPLHAQTGSAHRITALPLGRILSQTSHPVPHSPRLGDETSTHPVQTLQVHGSQSVTRNDRSHRPTQGMHQTPPPTHQATTTVSGWLHSQL